MCGRYVLKMHRQLELLDALVDVEDWPTEDRYNVCPTQLVPTLRILDGRKVVNQVRWGLIPFFAKGKPGPYSMVNARLETFQTSAAYRSPWKRSQRCLQFASGFYEWHMDGERKAPFYIHLADQETFAFASLWDRSIAENGTAIDSTVIITMPANSLMKHIHNTGNNPHRMPAMLAREDWEVWLTGSPDEAGAALRQYPEDRMAAWEVSTRVNSPKNQGPELIAPVTA